jgi:hypothetical protein
MILVLVQRKLFDQQLLHHHHLLSVLAHLSNQVPVQPLRHKYHHDNHNYNHYDNHNDYHDNQDWLKSMKMS